MKINGQILSIYLEYVAEGVVEPTLEGFYKFQGYVEKGKRIWDEIEDWEVLEDE